jgi:hypothetical protein
MLASFRSRAVTVGTQALNLSVNNAPEANRVMTEFGADLKVMADAMPEHEGFKALNADVNGRMTKAIDGSQRFNRWGKHYLRAITRSHQLMQQTNYMDTGLQVYGGPSLENLRKLEVKPLH